MAGRRNVPIVDLRGASAVLMSYVPQAIFLLLILMSSGQYY